MQCTLLAWQMNLPLGMIHVLGFPSHLFMYDLCELSHFTVSPDSKYPWSKLSVTLRSMTLKSKKVEGPSRFISVQPGGRLLPSDVSCCLFTVTWRRRMGLWKLCTVVAREVLALLFLQ